LILRFVEEGVHERLRTKEGSFPGNEGTLGRTVGNCQRISKSRAAPAEHINK